MKLLKSNHNFFMSLIGCFLLVLKSTNIIDFQLFIYLLTFVCLEQIVVDIYTIIVKNSLDYNEFIKIDDMMEIYLSRTTFFSFLLLFGGIASFLSMSVDVFLTLLCLTNTHGQARGVV